MLVLPLLLLAGSFGGPPSRELLPERVASIYDVEVNDLESGLPVGLSHYRGKVMLIINVASLCGSTEFMYFWLNKLHEKYSHDGLAILAFPCDQFGSQEPGSSQDILHFARTRMGAKFDLFEKTKIYGPERSTRAPAPVPATRSPTMSVPAR